MDLAELRARLAGRDGTVPEHARRCARSPCHQRRAGRAGPRPPDPGRGAGADHPRSAAGHPAHQANRHAVLPRRPGRFPRRAHRPGRGCRGRRLAGGAGGGRTAARPGRGHRAAAGLRHRHRFPHHSHRRPAATGLRARARRRRRWRRCSSCRLSVLLDPAAPERRRAQWKGRDREFWVWPHARHYIWGATAAILVHLAHRMREAARCLMLRAGRGGLGDRPVLLGALLYGIVVSAPAQPPGGAGSWPWPSSCDGSASLVWQGTTEGLRPHERYVPAQMRDGGRRGRGPWRLS